jgi:hypothetical protein
MIIDVTSKNLHFLIDNYNFAANDFKKIMIIMKRTVLIVLVLLFSLQLFADNNQQAINLSDVIAGNAVDANRIRGDVIVESGVKYEIEATGTVRLEDGFKVEKGATFAVYPSCF